MDIYEIRKANLLKLIGTQAKGTCANRWGMAPAHLSQILSDKTAKNLGDDVARRIEEVERLPRGWFDSLEPTAASSEAAAESVSLLDQLKQMLEKGGKGISEEQRLRLLAAAEEQQASAPERSNVITADFSRPGAVGDEIRIAHYDVRAAMGGGQIPNDYIELLRDVTVSQEHLRRLGVDYESPFHLKMITGWGQSMAPTIQDKDPLLIDVSIDEYTGDGIYLFNEGEYLFIKRLQLADAERFEVISDNEKHKDRQVRKEDIYIRGRILLVWNAHRV